MSAFAAVMTGKGTGAISTIEVFGDSAEATVAKIFEPAGHKSADFKTGKVLLGTITDGTETIDQVVIGCEGPDDFAINCHGNPLIVEMIMELLQRHGAKLIRAEQLLAKRLAAQEALNTIAVEAKLAQAEAMTLEGTKIVLNQIKGGLNKRATGWLRDIDSISLDEIRAQAARILKDSRRAKLIIAGCTAAIVGPPNSGKSTLLNYLCGKQKAIVTDIKGTTRDWVSARCQIGPLSVELIDTAGLDEALAGTPASSIDRAAQDKALEILAGADLVLLVLDSSEPASQVDERLVERITHKKVLTVLNKSDLPARLNVGKLPTILSNTVQISAKLGTGIETLIERILHICGAVDFDLQTPVCITTRQKDLLKKLGRSKSGRETASIITELLNGPLEV
ncbi:MAG: GTPase [Planctomycetota bacterium]|jgi:tRNA modification GTPase